MYLHGVSDTGARLLFKFRAGINEELGRHKGRNGMTGFILCGDECDSVVHVYGSVLLTKIVGKSLWFSSGPY